MAEVELAPGARPEVSADLYLKNLLNEWRHMPETSREFEKEWGEPERIDFIVEWDIPRANMKLLRQWRDQGSLSDEQLRKLATIERLEKEYGELLRRMLEDAA